MRFVCCNNGEHKTEGKEDSGDKSTKGSKTSGTK